MTTLILDNHFNIAFLDLIKEKPWFRHFLKFSVHCSIVKSENIGDRHFCIYQPIPSTGVILTSQLSARDPFTDSILLLTVYLYRILSTTHIIKK